MRLLDDEGLRAKGLNYSRSHRHRLVQAGRFPPPIRLAGAGSRSVWPEKEIDKYIDGLVAARDRDGEAA